MKTLLLLAGLGTWMATAHARDFVTANDQARYLAGLPVPADSPIETLTLDAAWKRHATEMDAAWAAAESRSLSRVRDWAQKFIRSANSSAPCYYMFSGPDILYAQTIYPNASTYVLCGAEPVGSIPDFTKIAAGPTLDTLRRSLATVLKYSYFITKDMRSDLGEAGLGGTMPVMYLFLSRLGCTIDDAQYVSLSPSGELGKGKVPGVRIDFRGKGGRQTVYYFKADLSNGGSGAAVMNFCNRQGASGLGLLKAASYLLHEPGFSKCREFLLSDCRVIVQDDSGIPLKYYAPTNWQIRYFGAYAGTTGGPFAKYFQPDLANAYSTVQPVEVDFQLSYQWNTKIANVQVAVRSGK